MQPKPEMNKYTQKIYNVLSPLVKGGLRPKLGLVDWQNDYWSKGLILNRLTFIDSIRDKYDTLLYGNRIAQDGPSELRLYIEITTEKYLADKLIDWDYINKAFGYIVYNQQVDQCNQN